MKKLLFSFLVLAYGASNAQVGLVNQYHFNYLAINPALAGENGPFTVKGIVGNQFNGNLRFNQLSHVLVLDGQLYNKTGLAFQSSSDNYGIGSANNLGLSLSKGIEVGDLRLKGGVSGGASFLPNTLIGATGTRAEFNLGLGMFASYNGVFAGVSKPTVLKPKNAFSQEGPLFVNVGYTSQDEDNFVTYNANILFASLNSESNYDFNLKLWFNKRLALGGSYRVNNIYNLYTKKNNFIPSAEYKFTEDLVLGLAYNTNTLRLSNTSTTGNPNFKMNGIFQFYIRYNKADRKGDSWYYDQF